MDPTYFETLLYEDEGDALDFKRDQYPFANATDDDKSEILKDILGMANAWRRTDVSYILIGVDDLRGARSIVHGVAAHLADHALQQFVNSKTNKPIRFRYEAFGVEGKQIGIIHVEKQERPFYLTKDYGKLKRGEVYVRRGSSTDPTKPAKPEEIALMGRDAVAHSAELTLEWADVETLRGIGRHTAIKASYISVDIKDDKIPDYELRGLGLGFAAYLPNKDYYRELVAFLSFGKMSQPLRLLLTNTGGVPATNIIVELKLPKEYAAMWLYKHNVPKEPSQCNKLDVRHISMKAIQHPSYNISISDTSDEWLIKMEAGNLQPGRALISDVFYIAAAASTSVPVSGRVFADNLSAPQLVPLSIDADVKERSITWNEFVFMHRGEPPKGSERI